eukprot:31110-Pelagococcus_subviridis.AAC.1
MLLQVGRAGGRHLDDVVPSLAPRRAQRLLQPLRRARMRVRDPVRVAQAFSAHVRRRREELRERAGIDLVGDGEEAEDAAAAVVDDDDRHRRLPGPLAE